MRNLSKLKYQPLVYALFSGILLGLTFPRGGLFLLSFAALVPLFLSLQNSSFWQAFGRGYVFGITFSLIDHFWLFQFVSKWTNSWIMGAIPYVLVVLIFSLYFALFAASSTFFLNRGIVWVIPFVWAGVEFFRSIIPYLYYPWSLLGTSLYKLPILLQPAWWGGVYFLSAFIVLVNLFIFMLLKNEPAQKMRYYLMVIVIIFIGSIWTFQAELEGESKNVFVAQPDVDMAFSTQLEINQQLSEKIPPLLEIGQGTKRDLILLPEGIGKAQNTNVILPFTIQDDTPIIVGVQRINENKTHQSIYAYDGKWSFADKTRLVIYGEYVPFRNLLKHLEKYNLPSADLTHGDRIEIVETAGMKIGALICFEALFEDVAREQTRQGAQILVVPSIDTWYENTSAIEHLVSASVVRAVENRLPVLRSNPRGHSLIIDAKGQIIAKAKQGENTVIRAEIQVASQPVMILRDVFPWLSLCVWITALVLSVVTKGSPIQSSKAK